MNIFKMRFCCVVFFLKFHYIAILAPPYKADQGLGHEFHKFCNELHGHHIYGFFLSHLCRS